jgi:hypothetical protein
MASQSRMFEGSLSSNRLKRRRDVRRCVRQSYTLCACIIYAVRPKPNVSMGRVLVTDQIKLGCNSIEPIYYS